MERYFKSWSKLNMEVLPEDFVYVKKGRGKWKGRIPSAIAGFEDPSERAGSLQATKKWNQLDAAVYFFLTTW
jgi:hypothetical protein